MTVLFVRSSPWLKAKVLCAYYFSSFTIFAEAAQSLALIKVRSFFFFMRQRYELFAFLHHVCMIYLASMGSLLPRKF